MITLGACHMIGGGRRRTARRQGLRSRPAGCRHYVFYSREAECRVSPGPGAGSRNLRVCSLLQAPGFRGGPQWPPGIPRPGRGALPSTAPWKWCHAPAPATHVSRQLPGPCPPGHGVGQV